MFVGSACSLVRFLWKQRAGYGCIAGREACLSSLGLGALGKMLHSPELVLGSWWCWTRLHCQQKVLVQCCAAPWDFCSCCACGLWWNLPHFPCCGQVLLPVSRCEMFNWVHLLCVCRWSDMLVVWFQARLYRVAQSACVVPLVAIACRTGAFLHMGPSLWNLSFFSTSYSVGPALMLARQPRQSSWQQEAAGVPPAACYSYIDPSNKCVPIIIIVCAL